MEAAGMTKAPTSPRPRSRGFSFRSDKSAGSKDAESPAEKTRRDSLWKGSKANPNAALTESQPAALNLLEVSTIQPLRAVQHKDVHGNPITDPDLSNPTRPRLERPLDTIRSFEKAIDNGYKRRTSYRAESHEQNGPSNHSRRSSSYFGGGGQENGHGAGQKTPGGGYYGGPRDSYMSHGPNGPPRQRQGPAQRQPSDPTVYSQRPHGQHSHQQSLDTMNTNGSDSTGPWANSTDPSSENSSIDRVPANKENGYPTNGHNQNGGWQGSIPEEGGSYPMPRAPVNNAPRPIPLGNTAAQPTNLPTTPRPETEKRKSWIKRRFSKQT